MSNDYQKACVKKFGQVSPIFEALFGSEHNLKSVDVITGEKTYYKDKKVKKDGNARV